MASQTEWRYDKLTAVAKTKIAETQGKFIELLGFDLSNIINQMNHYTTFLERQRLDPEQIPSKQFHKAWKVQVHSTYRF